MSEAALVALYSDPVWDDLERVSKRMMLDVWQPGF